MKLAFALLALSGCELIANIPTPLATSSDASTTGDGGVADVAIDEMTCFGTFRSICMQPSETDVDLPASLDTDTSALCATYDDVDGPACFVSGRSVNLAAGVSLTVTGARPLVLLAATTITLDGTMKLENAPALGCTLTPATVIGGGAGGSRGGAGGKGGNAEDSVGGQPGPATPASLLGGCPGGASVQNSGVPGVGGGSALVIATTIAVTGTVNASGTGGTGATASIGGGAGGGSGGVIILDAPNVTITGTVLAAGGGGGEGGRGTIFGGNQGGNHGATPDPMTPALRAPGGTGGNGGDGGDGGGALAVNGTDGGQSGAQFSTGGGGGGGAGIIVITAATPTITGPVVPAPIP